MHAVNGTTDRPETVSRTVVDEVTVVKPGFFTRLKNKLTNNPIKTSVSVSMAAGGAAYAAYNMRRYGTLLPPEPVVVNEGGVVETVAEFASFFSGR